MRRQTVLALVISGVCGLATAVVINDWMSDEFRRMQAQFQQPTEIKPQLSKLVVAKQDVAAGVQLTRDKLQEADWPVDNIPTGAFRSIDELLGENSSRVALAAIYANEPINSERVAGEGQRSGLATMLERGRRAVSIRVNDVVSVGGLVLPGHLVDIFVTYTNAPAQDQKSKAVGEDDQAYTDLLLQNVRVLAVDQMIDPAHSEPVMGRTVTVEATLADAQKITLAATLGSLSLALRDSGSASTVEKLPRLTAADLPGDSGDNLPVGVFITSNGVAPDTKVDALDTRDPHGGTTKISIIRATTPTEYTVTRRN